MIFRVLDIETVPDYAIWSPGEPKYVQKVTEGKTGYSVSWCKEEPFPPALACKVVSIAWCDLVAVASEGPRIYKFQSCHTSAGWDMVNDRGCERAMIAAFGRVCVETPATLVTWNGRTFDLPVLAMRALHCGVPWSWYYEEKSIRYRYSEEGHCDLMDVFSDYGAARFMKLDDACRLVGLPGKMAGDITGVSVLLTIEKFPHAEAVTKISNYCLQDVLQTALFFVRSRFHFGRCPVEGYQMSLDTFKVPEVESVIDLDWDKLKIPT